MEEKAQVNKPKKGFFGRLLDKLDKKLEEKAKSCCCNSKGKQGGGSCCS